MPLETRTLPHSHAAPQRRIHPAAVLTVVLVASLAINVETTIVNVALPTLNSELGASTRGLQWIVDSYNLAFAALVLATRPLARWLRRPTVLRSLDALTGLALMGFGLRLALSRPTS